MRKIYLMIPHSSRYVCSTHRIKLKGVFVYDYASKITFIK